MKRSVEAVFVLWIEDDLSDEGFLLAVAAYFEMRGVPHTAKRLRRIARQLKGTSTKRRPRR